MRANINNVRDLNIARKNQLFEKSGVENMFSKFDQELNKNFDIRWLVKISKIKSIRRI